jgi:tetratricopeptide (TPR) repeat protein
LTLAAFAAVTMTAATIGPLSLDGALAAGSDTPSPPASDSKSTKSNKKSGEKGFQEENFLQAYRAAYATIYQRQDYAAGITQLQALEASDRADVANLIGYSYRKLGNYQVAQAWYERALKADPAHLRTWQYYGLWQLEQGNREQAQYHLTKIGALCGTDCSEYRSLAAALDAPPGTAAVY